jgi:hypothetical protein
MQVGPTGQSIPQVLISLTQTITILAEGQKFELYRVSKSVDNASTRKRTSEFLAEAAKDPLRALFFVPDSSCPFAALHQLSRAL